MSKITVVLRFLHFPMIFENQICATFDLQFSNNLKTKNFIMAVFIGL